MSDNTLKIWDWSSNTVLFTLNWTPNSNSYAYSCVKFLSNGLLVAPYNNTVINVWNVMTGQVQFSLTGSVFGLEQLSNSNLMSSGSDNFLRIWNSNTGKLILQLNTGAWHFRIRQTLIPNLVATSCYDKNIYIWDINTLNQVNKLVGHSNQVYFLDLTSSGLLLSNAINSDNSVKLWNVSITSPLNSFTCPTRITCMKVLSDRQLVVGFQANYLQFINISSSNVLSLASQVNLITNSQLYDMKLTSQNILILSQLDGTVLFMNTNTTTYLQALTPNLTAVTYNFDIIGRLFY
jgi:WD40 repeat protein